jgi:hypothetical protein
MGGFIHGQSFVLVIINKSVINGKINNYMY